MKPQSVSLIAQQNSLIEQRDALERQIEKLREEVTAITDIADQVRLMAQEAGVSLTEIAFAIAPDLAKGFIPQEAAPAPARTRQVKVYVHPDTQEKIETKGGNHTRLKEWKAQYGGSTVEGWRIDNK